MITIERGRRDWILFAIIIPLGILLMFLAGQQAIQMLPRWNVNADMNSNLDPNNPAGAQGLGFIEPLRAEIQTPAAWMATFLTPHPGQDASQTPAPLLIFDPSATPSPTAPPTGAVTSTSSPTSSATATVTGTPPTATVTATKTKKPSATPPTATATSTATSTATATGTATGTPTGTASPTASPTTIDPSLTPVTPAPTEVNIGAPDNTPATPPDGTYYVINMSGNPIVVNGPSDTNYDLAYYEVENPAGSGQVAMDQVTIGITNDPTGQTYYQVFNWGDGKPDTNSNVDTSDPAQPVAINPTEADNEPISTADLHQDPAAPASPQTGVLIDVDNAPSAPPPATYNYVVIISPPASAPNNAGDGGQTDAVEVVDVPNP